MAVSFVLLDFLLDVFAPCGPEREPRPPVLPLGCGVCGTPRFQLLLASWVAFDSYGKAGRRCSRAWRRRGKSRVELGVGWACREAAEVVRVLGDKGKEEEESYRGDPRRQTRLEKESVGGQLMHGATQMRRARGARRELTGEEEGGRHDDQEKRRTEGEGRETGEEEGEERKVGNGRSNVRGGKWEHAMFA